MLITNVTGNYFLKQNDTATEIHLAVIEVDGTPVDLSAAPRVEVVIGTIEGRMLTKTPTLLSAPGEFTFGLDEGDLLPQGDNLLEVHIFSEDGGKRVAPSKGHYKLKVQRSIGTLGMTVTTYTLDYFISEVNRITYGLPELVDRVLETADRVEDVLGRSENLVESAELALELSQTAQQVVGQAMDDIVPALSDTLDATLKAKTATVETKQAAADASTATQLASLAAQEANSAKNAAESAAQQALSAKDGATAAAQQASATAANLQGYNLPITNFSMAARYVKHQPARNNGSTYRAKKETQGNPLPVDPATENEWWTLEARAGVDGQGAVSTVNGVAPDLSGNVDLPSSSSIEVVNDEIPVEDRSPGTFYFIVTDSAPAPTKVIKASPTMGLKIIE